MYTESFGHLNKTGVRATMASKLEEQRSVIKFQLLTFTTLWAFSADDKMMLFFLFFPENRIWHFMQIVSLGDNLHEMSNPVFWEK